MKLFFRTKLYDFFLPSADKNFLRFEIVIKHWNKYFRLYMDLVPTFTITTIFCTIRSVFLSSNSSHSYELEYLMKILSNSYSSVVLSYFLFRFAVRLNIYYSPYVSSILWCESTTSLCRFSYVGGIGEMHIFILFFLSFLF